MHLKATGMDTEVLLYDLVAFTLKQLLNTSLQVLVKEEMDAEGLLSLPAEGKGTRKKTSK